MSGKQQLNEPRFCLNFDEEVFCQQPRSWESNPVYNKTMDEVHTAVKNFDDLVRCSTVLTEGIESGKS